MGGEGDMRPGPCQPRASLCATMAETAIAASPTPRRGPGAATLAGASAAVLWAAFCLLWFDVARPWRPAALAGVPPLAVLAGAAVAALFWLRGRWPALRGPALGSAAPSL